MNTVAYVVVHCDQYHGAVSNGIDKIHSPTQSYFVCDEKTKLVTVNRPNATMMQLYDVN